MKLHVQSFILLKNLINIVININIINNRKFYTFNVCIKICTYVYVYLQILYITDYFIVKLYSQFCFAYF